MSTLIAAGRRLEYRWISQSRPGAPPLVLLHEGLGAAALWGDFPRRLAERTGSGILVYSRHGFGRSEPFQEPRATDYLEREALEALPEVLATRGIERPVLVGHSDGATIALLHAADGRWPVRGLVLESPHVFVEEPMVQRVERARSAYNAGSLREQLRPWHADVDATFQGWTDLWLEARFRGWNVERRLPAVECPTLVIQGKDDQYGTLAQVAAIQRRTSGPVRTVVLPECGHAPHADRVEEVLDEMAGFIGRL